VVLQIGNLLSGIAELFAYEGGDTLGVSHYLFEKAFKSVD